MASRSLVSKQKPSFKQQNLPAWQPILTAGTVLPTFFLIGVAFVPIGIGLLMSSTTVQEKRIDYTDCESFDQPGKPCSLVVPLACKCQVDFDLDEDFRKDLYVYYSLSNFYQNHRRYVKSRDDSQLLGNPKSVSSDCSPFDYSKENGLPIAPCGAIANSMFNDTFKLEMKDPDGNKNRNIVLSETGIAWSTDKKIRFQNPPHVEGSDGLKAAFNGTAKPPNWKKFVYELDDKHNDNNGFQNEHLIVWMRTAALPTFRKLWATVNIKDSFDQQDLDALPSGKYSLTIKYNYPVTMFHGKKYFILSNTSWLGGKNHFLGIAYIVVGCICFLLSSCFLYIHKRYGRLPSEITQITQTTPYLTS